MGWGIRVCNGIREQGKNITRDYFTIGTSVGCHRVPHRRGMVLMGKSWHGRMVIWSCPCPYSTWVVLVLGTCLLFVLLWVQERYYGYWMGERPLPLPLQACRPSGLGINLSSASALPHGVPTCCLFALACPFGPLLNLEGSSLLSPSQSSLLPPLAFLLFPHCHHYSLFLVIICDNKLNNGDIPMMSLEYIVASPLF